MSTILFTVGYEGLTLQQCIRLLIVYGVELLVDVRDLPLSRKKGFSKKPLSLAVAEAGKEYLHLKALGCPPDIRHDYRDDGDWGRYVARYNTVLGNRVSALHELSILSREKRCALLCYEADAQYCHRSLIAWELQQRWNPELSVMHITTNSNKPIQTGMSESVFSRRF